MTLKKQLETTFRPLEIRTLQALWQRQAPSSVRELTSELPDIPYTTLMTAMDRLFRRCVLSRRKRGRAFVYVPTLSQTEQVTSIAYDRFSTILPQHDSGAAKPILHLFVQTVSERDESLLDELEQLIRQRRAWLRARRAGQA